MVRRNACWAPAVMLSNVSHIAREQSLVYEPVCFIENDQLVATRR